MLIIFYDSSFWETPGSPNAGSKFSYSLFIMVAIRCLAFSSASLTKQLDWTWNYLTLCLERICFRILGGGGDRIGIRFPAVAFMAECLKLAAIIPLECSMIITWNTWIVTEWPLLTGLYAKYNTRLNVTCQCSILKKTGNMFGGRAQSRSFRSKKSIHASCWPSYLICNSLKQACFNLAIRTNNWFDWGGKKFL